MSQDPFTIKHKVLAKVQNNYHITLGENYHHYSVPYLFIGKQVTTVYDTDIVEVNYQFQRIALHRRSYRETWFYNYRRTYACRTPAVL